MEGKPRGEVRAAAPRASYLHVADDGLEEASKRAAFLLDHSLHFPGAAGTGPALGAAALRTGPGSLSPGAVSPWERLAAGFAESTRCSRSTALCPPSHNPKRPAAPEGESLTCSARFLTSKMPGED